MNINDTIFFFFYDLDHQSKLFDKFVIFTADIFPYIVVLLALMFLLMHHEIFSSVNPFREFVKKWKEFFLVFFSSGFAWFFAYFLKILIHIERPFIIFPSISPLFTDTGFAFPSGHATFFGALATSIFLNHKKAGYVFMFFAFLIGLARIIAGIHFPIDILGGFVLGGLIAYFIKNV